MVGNAIIQNGERVIVPQTGYQLPNLGEEYDVLLGPVGMPNRWVGGTAPSPEVPSIWHATGLYNVGLLVNVWGRVTSVDQVGQPPSYFYIDDGSGLSDGSGVIGLRVIVPPNTTMPSVGSYVWLTGISSAYTPVQTPVRSVRLRSDQPSDWGVVNYWDTCRFSISANEWQDLPLSMIPAFASAEAVFEAVPNEPAVDLYDYLRRFHLDSQTWMILTTCSEGVFGSYLPGDCFLLYRPYGSPTHTECPAIAADQWDTGRIWDHRMGLPRNGTIYVTNPLNQSAPWSSCRFTDGTTLKSPHEAYLDGWITAEPTGSFTAGIVYSLTTGDYDLALIVPDVE